MHADPWFSQKETSLQRQRKMLARTAGKSEGWRVQWAEGKDTVFQIDRETLGPVGMGSLRTDASIVLQIQNSTTLKEN